MNRTMVKRGIGAAALAIVAALLLGYLLKGKDQERQDVVDMTLPGAQEVKKSLNIPSLGGNKVKDGAKDAAGNAGDGAKNAGETVVASAGALGNAANEDIKTKKTAVNTYENKGDDLDFTIRPPKGEKREIVDNIGKSKQQQQQPKSQSQDVASAAQNNNTQKNTGAISRPADGSVVASTSEPSKKAYRARLVGEKERKASYGIVVAEPSSKQRNQERARIQAKKDAAAKKRAQKIAAAKKQAQSAPKTTGKKGSYTIQLLATSSSSRANALKNVMSKEGYSSSVSKTTRNGKVLFRVRVGGYKNRQAAIAAQSKMKRRYQKNQYVKGSMVVSK